MGGYVLAIDQGTTSTPGDRLRRRHEGRRHGPEGIHADLSALRLGRARSGGNLGSRRLDRQAWRCEKAEIEATDIAALGITNQRETVVVWERETGKPIHNAIVWQDRRTASYCDKLKQQDLEKTLHQEDRPAARSLFLRHQAFLDARQREGRAGAGRQGRALLRHDRYLPDLAADGRQELRRPMRPMPRAR